MQFVLAFPDISPTLVEIPLGPVSLPIRWYALAYIVGIYLGYLLIRRAISRPALWHFKSPPMSREALEEMLTWMIVGIILGGRMGYVLFYGQGSFWENPLDILKVWEGGMSFHGGFIGVVLALIWFARSRRQHWTAISDFIAPLVPLGLAAGRLGNFINAELWGRPAGVPWAMVFPNVDNVARHPSQLYELALEGVVLFAVLWWYSMKPRPRGAVSAAFLVGYGLFRFAVEYTREPDSFLGLLAFNLSMGQWLSLPMVIAGIAMFAWAARASPPRV